MILSHVIRLHGPWELRPLWNAAGWSSPEEARQLGDGGRVEIPSPWGDLLGASFRGRVVYTRGFGMPTGIEHDQRIDLVVERVDAFGSAYLNGELLGDVGEVSARFNVTARLKSRNQLVIEVEKLAEKGEALPSAPSDRAGLPGGLIGEVRLEILDSDEFMRAYDEPFPTCTP